MSDIALDLVELALWKEVGSRGDAFRRAIRDRAAETVRVQQQPVRIIDGTDTVIELVTSSSPDPESCPAS